MISCKIPLNMLTADEVNSLFELMDLMEVHMVKIKKQYGYDPKVPVDDRYMWTQINYMINHDTDIKEKIKEIKTYYLYIIPITYGVEINYTHPRKIMRQKEDKI